MQEAYLASAYVEFLVMAKSESDVLRVVDEAAVEEIQQVPFTVELATWLPEGWYEDDLPYNAEDNRLTAREAVELNKRQ